MHGTAGISSGGRTAATDNSSFTISGTELRTAAVFDFQVKASYLVRVQVMDVGCLSFLKDFTIRVTEVIQSEHKVFLPLIKR